MPNLSTDSADHGLLYPGWSQEESASPHILGDNSGETRQTSFTAIANADSDLMIGEQITVTGPFNSTGVALDGTLVGDMVSTSVYDVDSRFLPVRHFFPVQSGFEEAALDMFQRVYGSGGLTLPWVGRGRAHAYYPLRGYGQGFVPDGGNTPYYQSTWGDGVVYSTAESGSYYWGKSAAPTNYYVRLDTGVYATSTRVVHSPIFKGTNVNYQSMRVRLIPGSSIRSRVNIQWAGLPETNIDVDIEGTTGTSGRIVISGTYRQFGASSSTAFTTVTSALTGLSTASEIGMVMQWGYLTAAENATLRVKVYAFDPMSPPTGAPTVVAQVDLTNAARGQIASQNSTISRNVAGAVGFRDLVLSQTDSSWPVHYPVPVEPSLLDVNIDTTEYRNLSSASGLSARDSVIPAWEGSGWDYLKMLCTARALEIKVSGPKLAVSDLFPISGTQPVANTISEPTLNIQATGRSRSIDVIQYGSIARRTFAQTPTDGTIVVDVNLTIGLNQEIVYTADLPPGDYQIGNIVAFEIFDADDIAQTWTEIHWAGARMTPTVDIDGSLTIVFRGPSRENVNWIGGAHTGVGPWKIGKLRIANQGYFETSNTIELYTGAPEAMVTREKGGNVDNPFLCTVADVFDRSTWLISSEGSPHVSLSFSVPANDRSKYLVGRVVTYGWGHFRVMQVTHSKESTSVECDWFATQEQQSLNWAGQTANQWNTYWAGRRAYDVTLRPLASPVPVVNPQPFIRAYPSESKNPR